MCTEPVDTAQQPPYVEPVSVPESEQLADTFATIARELEAASDPQETREVVTRRAVETVPGCTSAGISLVRRFDRVITVAPTNGDAERIHEIQNEVNEGPCLSAIVDHVVYQIDDLLHDQRWPRFAERVAAEMSVGSMLSFRLFTAEETAGALNLYGGRPHAFDTHSRAIGAVLAAHAAIAMLSAGLSEDTDNLKTALDTNREIGIAIGILMHAENLSREQALDFLVDSSQRLNRKLRDVAAAIVEWKGVPGSLDSRRE